MKKNILFSLFLLATLVINAQDIWQPGFIVKQNNDSIHGLILSKSTFTNYSICKYKKESNSEVKIYLPNEIKSYGVVDGATFESRWLEPTSKDSLYFLKVLAKGKASLYQHKEIFYLEKDTALYELSVKDYIYESSKGVSYKKTTTKHIGILTYQLRDYPELTTKIQSIRLAPKPLTQLIDKYNNFFNQSEKIQTKKKWITLEPFISAGVNISNIQYDYCKLNTIPLMGDFKDESTPYISVGTYFTSPRVSKAFSIYFGLNLSSYQWNSQFSRESNATDYFYNVSVEYTSLETPIGVRYQQHFGKYYPYICAGFIRMWHQSTNQTSILRRRDINATPETTDNIYGLDKGANGVWFSVGVSRKGDKSFFAPFIEYRSQSCNNSVGNNYGLEYTINSNTFTFGLKF